MFGGVRRGGRAGQHIKGGAGVGLGRAGRVSGGLHAQRREFGRGRARAATAWGARPNRPALVAPLGQTSRGRVAGDPVACASVGAWVMRALCCLDALPELGQGEYCLVVGLIVGREVGSVVVVAPLQLW